MVPMKAGGLGRIAGIAVTVGVGAAAATGAVGVAAAAPADDSAASADSTAAAPAVTSAATRGTARAADGVRRVERKPQRQRRDAPPAAGKPASAARALPQQVKTDPALPARMARPAATVQEPAHPAATVAQPALQLPALTARSVAPRAAAASLTAAPATGTVDAVPSPFTSTGPGSPAEATVGWVVLAAVRRLGRSQPAVPAAAAVSTGQTLVAAARGRNPFSLFSNRTPTLSPAQTGQSATGVVSGSLNAADADGDPLTFTVNTNPAHGTVAVDGAGQFRYTPDVASAHTGVTDSFTVTVSDATGRTHYHGFASLFSRRGNTGHTATRTVTVTVAPVNVAPTGSGTAGAPNVSTGVVTGQVSGSDGDGDPLSYNGSGATAKGSVVVAADGSFSYTPTAAARHAAAKLSAPVGDKTDTVIVTITDGHGGSVAIPVLVAIAPANAAPTGAATAGSPDPATGVVRGSLGAADSDQDTLSYAAPATTAKGAIAVADDGTFTYTPTAAARHAAASPSATAADRADAFTVTASDGHGGSIAIPVAVAVGASNAAPTGSVGVGTPDRSTGLVAGSVTGSDTDGDPLTYSGSTSTTKGTVTVGPDGGFTYRPTATARHLAAALTAGVGDTTDTFAVMVADNYGGSTAVPVLVAISPANTAPTASAGAVTTDPATGVVSGRVTGSDADADPLSYTGSVMTSKGTAAVEAGGSFTYTPTAAARHAAAKLTATAADKADAFTITVADGHGGTVDVPIAVTVTPDNAAPTASANVGAPDAVTGVLAGALIGSDTNGDALSYSGSQTTARGTVVVAPDGSFTYTPTAVARHVASLANVPQTETVDSFTLAVADGYGGTVNVPITVAVSPASVGFNFAYGSGAQYWTAAERTALQSAANRLSSYIVVNAPVTLTYDVVGQRDPNSGLLATAYAKFATSAPGFYGTVVQTKVITGADQNGPNNTDSQIIVNFAYPWALGDSVPNNQYDFQSVAMHELVHTFGFMTGLGDPSGTIDRNWTTYDKYLATANGVSPIGGDYVWNAAYTPNLTGSGGGLYFTGPNAEAAYGGPVPIYTPSPWSSGSSLTHLDPADAPAGVTYLMDPNDGFGPGVRVVTPVELGVLKDLGYTVYQGPFYA